MNDLVLVGAQRRITLMVKLPGNRKPMPITFWPATPQHPNRVNRCPRDIWEALRKKKQSPRQDQQAERSPIEEYLETGLLWAMNPGEANAINEGRRPLISPAGPIGAAHRPQPREPVLPEGLQHAQNEATPGTVELPTQG